MAPTVCRTTGSAGQKRHWTQGVTNINQRPRGATDDDRARIVTLARYGVRMTPRGRLITIICVALVSAAALAALVWIALYHANPPVRGTLLGYEVTSDRAVAVRFEVWRKQGVTAQCVVRARNAEGVEVGSRVITIPAGEHRVQETVVLETRSRAITGELKDCREAAAG